MKVSELKEGMMLVVSSEKDCPVIRHVEPDRLTFFPDIFAQSGFGNITILDKTAYYMYIGKVTYCIPVELRAKYAGQKTKMHHELMDPRGIVYKVHGREFKHFTPVWRNEDENSNN